MDKKDTWDIYNLHHIFIYYMISDTNLRQFICVMFKMQTPSETIQYKYFLTDVSV